MIPTSWQAARRRLIGGVALALLASAAVYSLAQSLTPEECKELQDFEQVLVEWKQYLTRLRDQDNAFRTAPANQQEELKKQYDEMIPEGEALANRLLDAAVLAFAKAPDCRRRREILGFLEGVIESEVKNDRYETALRVAQLLIDNKVQDNELFDVAGVAAFCSNQFDVAEKHLKRAKELKLIGKSGEKILTEIAIYKAIWSQEQELRSPERTADLPRVLLRTNKGEIEIELFENEAPNTVASFISLVEKGFYNNLKFFRVEAGKTAVAGCPKGDGTGHPGYRMLNEALSVKRRIHVRGSVGMATGDPMVNGSQFHIAFRPQQDLDAGQHCTFGRVVRGLEVLATLQRRKPRDRKEVEASPFDNVAIPPADVILEAKVLRKRDHPYEPKVVPITREEENARSPYVAP
jgi:cyclophilin family peptidyl-prolyl cis-trans isomerase